MKLAVTQTTLGIVIIIAACFVLAWMIFWTTPTQTIQLPAANGIEKSVAAHPADEFQYSIARYISGALLFLGIVVVLISTRQGTTKHRTVLASFQLAAGILIAGAAAFITARGYPLQFLAPAQPESNLAGVVQINPGPAEAFAILLTSLSVIFGLAVVGVAIAQLVISKKTVNA